MYSQKFMKNKYLSRIAIGTAQFTNHYGISNTHGVTNQDDVKINI